MKIKAEVDLADLVGDSYYGDTVEAVVRDEIVRIIKNEARTRLKKDREKIQLMIHKATDEQLEKVRQHMESLLKK